MADFSKLPSKATLDVKPFKANVDEEKLQHFKTLLELSPIGPAVFENTNVARKHGMRRDWLQDAKETWLHSFDWRQYESRINSFPNFKASIRDSEGHTVELHFLAMFSERTDAVPVVFLHGWPSSFCEFLDMLDMIKSRYTPKDLPYHIVVPSLPGYAYSSGPPLDREYGIDKAAGVINKLMIGLGFGSGYLAQGGDLGSFISRLLAMNYEACKGMHVNMMSFPASEMAEGATRDESEERALTRAREFIDTSSAFLFEQGSRPATIGLALSASPLALLSWLGEKFLEWSDRDPPLEKILESVTLYWLTDTFPRCLYHNRGMASKDETPKIARISVFTAMSQVQLPYIDKPCGYSMFANEIIPVPRSWAAKTCNLVSFSQHDRGGHFAAMEMPKELLKDVEDYVERVRGELFKND
ncbi:hypothetical protein HIM_04130 [Hirsutella minnesotensis 3608]|uniref:Epoxide hydrolase N-terminal domain-containing protein n=1 Tax=Hirsutella minnesotensis 3608 TaxID=1043627 RepID=A0A0F7ZLH1_9HYPO|nr:hypothetical protein HIM_04130 [Hirsutella minnesotensis 3608]